MKTAWCGAMGGGEISLQGGGLQAPRYSSVLLGGFFFHRGASNVTFAATRIVCSTDWPPDGQDGIILQVFSLLYVQTRNVHVGIRASYVVVWDV